MAEITVRDARDMDDSDARCILFWRDNTHESLVYGLTMQQLLSLYHASAKYVDLEGWLDEEKSAPKQYAQITGRKLEDAL